MPISKVPTKSIFEAIIGMPVQSILELGNLILVSKLISFLELIVDTLGMINTSSKPNFLSLLSIINLLPKNVKI